ncbi:MAG: hypothetical protein ACK5QW_03435, partial [Cyanobacteriota bacterium]
MTDPQDTAVPSANWEWVRDGKEDCTIFQRGLHGEGSFIRVYVPKSAEDPAVAPRAILYLHG